MPPVDINCASSRLPEGYAAVPVSLDQVAMPLRLCVLVKREPDQVGGALVLLGECLGGRVYLGCVLDAGDRIKQWLEVWVQSISDLAGMPVLCHETLTNALMDERWTRLAQSLEAVSDSEVLRAGWESDHPAPVFLDTGQYLPIHLKDEATGSPWALCLDDALLQQHDLPPYSGSLHRYLYPAGEAGEAVTFVAVTPDAPMNEHTTAMEGLVKAHKDWIPFNPEGGLILFRPFYPLTLDDFIKALAGEPCQSIQHGRSRLDPDDVREGLVAADDPGRMFLSARGAAGRLLETFYLKIQTFYQICRNVHAFVESQQQPLFNLDHHSFRVHVSGRDGNLPFLWTANVSLTHPGEAIPLAIKGSETRYHVRASAEKLSIYAPESAGTSPSGRAGVRIRQILDEGQKGTVLEGTFQTEADLQVNPRDLVWVRINLKSVPIDLYGYLEQDQALARGEWRLRTLGLSFDDPTKEGLQDAQGVPLQNCPFNIIPLYSTPCDLYALAVLGVKILLVDDQNPLPVALDELVSLAREAGDAVAKDGNLVEGIGSLFQRDTRWSTSLGPEHLVHEDMEPAHASAYVPNGLWWDTLAMLVRMFPGVSHHSTCLDYGSTSVGSLHGVFESAIEDSARLMKETRGLIVGDWGSRREIRNLIQEYADQLQEEKDSVS